MVVVHRGCCYLALERRPHPVWLGVQRGDWAMARETSPTTLRWFRTWLPNRQGCLAAGGLAANPAKGSQIKPGARRKRLLSAGHVASLVRLSAAWRATKAPGGERWSISP